MTLQVLDFLVTELPSVGCFVSEYESGNGPGGLLLTFVDDGYAAAKYKDLGKKYLAVRSRLQDFVEVRLEVLAASPSDAGRIRRFIQDSEGASVRDLGWARYFLAPRGTKKVFSDEKLAEYVKLIEEGGIIAR